MKPNDPIWYRQTQTGGYGFQRDVPGFFLRYTELRAIVQLIRKDGTPVQVAVDPNNLRTRHPQEILP